MKQFQTFITEARVTKASSQAKRLGLVGDGHGDWYDDTENNKELLESRVNYQNDRYGAGSHAIQYYDGKQSRIVTYGTHQKSIKICKTSLLSGHAHKIIHVDIAL